MRGTAGKYLFLFMAAALFFTAAPSAYALSEYGRICRLNGKCVKCRENVKCLTCLHDCYNQYGAADTVPGQKLTREGYCKKRQAKWCSAQCWDPDDKEEDDYVSTKPVCKTAY